MTKKSIKIFKILTIILLCFIATQLAGIYNGLSQLKDIENDSRTIQSELRDNSNALNCYMLNNKETEKEYYQCMYN